MIPYKLIGSVDYKIISKTHGIIDHVQKPNVVLRTVRDVITCLMGHGTDAITQFGVGTSTALPVDTDTALTGQVLSPLVSYDITVGNAVTFSYWFDYSLGNGLTIGEIGLLTTSGVLIARNIRQPFTKTSDMAIEGLWTLEYP